MIVKFIQIGLDDCSIEHVFECDSVEMFKDYGGTSFTMHSKTRGELKFTFPDDDMYDVYYMSDSGKTVDVKHVNQLKKVN